MLRLQGALVTALLLMAPALAQARELASAPEISSIGFSRDGRLSPMSNSRTTTCPARS